MKNTNKMKAESMFFMLGYKIIDANDYQITYKNGDSYVEISKDDIYCYMQSYENLAVGIDKEMLQAIHQQCKELGWFNEQ